jgi:hypothetical protein
MDQFFLDKKTIFLMLSMGTVLVLVATLVVGFSGMKDRESPAPRREDAYVQQSREEHAWGSFVDKGGPKGEPHKLAFDQGTFSESPSQSGNQQDTPSSEQVDREPEVPEEPWGPSNGLVGWCKHRGGKAVSMVRQAYHWGYSSAAVLRNKYRCSRLRTMVRIGAEKPQNLLGYVLQGICLLWNKENLKGAAKREGFLRPLVLKGAPPGGLDKHPVNGVEQDYILDCILTAASQLMTSRYFWCPERRRGHGCTGEEMVCIGCVLDRNPLKCGRLVYDTLCRRESRVHLGKVFAAIKDRNMAVNHEAIKTYMRRWCLDADEELIEKEYLVARFLLYVFGLDEEFKKFTECFTCKCEEYAEAMVMRNFPEFHRTVFPEKEPKAVFLRHLFRGFVGLTLLESTREDIHDILSPRLSIVHEIQERVGVIVYYEGGSFLRTVYDDIIFFACVRKIVEDLGSDKKTKLFRGDDGDAFMGFFLDIKEKAARIFGFPCLASEDADTSFCHLRDLLEDGRKALESLSPIMTQLCKAILFMDMDEVRRINSLSSIDEEEMNEWLGNRKRMHVTVKASFGCMRVDLHAHVYKCFASTCHFRKISCLPREERAEALKEAEFLRFDRIEFKEKLFDQSDLELIATDSTVPSGAVHFFTYLKKFCSATLERRPPGVDLGEVKDDCSGEFESALDEFEVLDGAFESASSGAETDQILGGLPPFSTGKDVGIRHCSALMKEFGPEPTWGWTFSLSGGLGGFMAHPAPWLGKGWQKPVGPEMHRTLMKFWDGVFVQKHPVDHFLETTRFTDDAKDLLRALLRLDHELCDLFICMGFSPEAREFVHYHYDKRLKALGTMKIALPPGSGGVDAFSYIRRIFEGHRQLEKATSALPHPRHAKLRILVFRKRILPLLVGRCHRPDPSRALGFWWIFAKMLQEVFGHCWRKQRLSSRLELLKLVKCMHDYLSDENSMAALLHEKPLEGLEPHECFMRVFLGYKPEAMPLLLRVWKHKMAFAQLHSDFVEKHKSQRARLSTGEEVRFTTYAGAVAFAYLSIAEHSKLRNMFSPAYFQWVAVFNKVNGIKGKLCSYEAVEQAMLYYDFVIAVLSHFLKVNAERESELSQRREGILRHLLESLGDACTLSEVGEVGEEGRFIESEEMEKKAGFTYKAIYMLLSPIHEPAPLQADELDGSDWNFFREDLPLLKACPAGRKLALFILEVSDVKILSDALWTRLSKIVSYGLKHEVL